ncbi:DNRLRE domain-containing protein [Sorangium sp. So ce302]|uniref:DNRLRE domain-containing protein n=1 Tax=Sorangium sp. So ce302 TaxID=3133297 RepID=UPI003F60F2A6
MRTLIVAWMAISALLPAACAQPTENGSLEESGEERSAVVGAGARPDSTHRAVVSLHSEDARCSGTIVRRSADRDKVYVLTAAHCCRESSPPKEVRIGFDLADPSLVLPVDSFQNHPCFDEREGSFDRDYDVCVVTVKDAGALEVTPIPIVSAADGLTVGSDVTIVGYGTSPATNNLRRRAKARVSEVTPLSLALGQTNEQGGVCAGDSGGPALIPQGGVEVVAGVTSSAAGLGLCDITGTLGRVAFPAIRDEFLDNVLAGEKSMLKGLIIQRLGISLGPVLDTYIASDKPDQSFGERAVLLVGAPPNTNAIRNALLRFDLTAVPRGATLLAARLGLMIGSTSEPGTISVHRVVKEWDESESWVSFGKDGFDATPVATSGNQTASVSTFSILSFDVTGLVMDWLSGKKEDHGMLLRARDGAQTQFLTSEIAPVTASSRPWMHLCYLPGPP